jgi:NAD(P)-dependent dehydrogenase (short-subunit alcohol dehydrogenase family)
MLLKDKTLIISGIGPGLGIKLSTEAACEGARGIVIGARTAAKLDEAEQLARAVNPACRVVKVVTDIRDPAQCQRIAETARAELGRIDALVNSAFFWGTPGEVLGSDLEGWKDVYQTNLIGTMQMVQAVAPVMKAQGGGAIVNVSTMASVKPHAGEVGYAASKGAVNVATKYLAQELGPSGIRVNLIRMGWMLGAPVKAYLEYAAREQGVPEKQIYDAVAANIALRRIVTDDECARAALFLVSDYASAVTGAVLDANGGEFLPP